MREMPVAAGDDPGGAPRDRDGRDESSRPFLRELVPGPGNRR